MVEHGCIKMKSDTKAVGCFRYKAKYCSLVCGDYVEYGDLFPLLIYKIIKDLGLAVSSNGLC